MSQNVQRKKNRRFVIVPLIVSIIIVSAFAVFIHNTETDKILSYKPENLWLAVLVFWGFFGLKSVSVVVPLTLLYIAVGSIYPYPVAILINLVGLTITFTIPYIIGRVSGGELIDYIESKYPKVQKLIDYGHDNNLFASYMSRAVIVVPADIMSIVYGALKMPYRPYLLGSLMGLLPEMLVQTYIGGSLSDLTVKSLLVMLLLIGLTFAFSILLNKKVSKAGKAADEDDF